jgi:hypothetical protein
MAGATSVSGLVSAAGGSAKAGGVWAVAGGCFAMVAVAPGAGGCALTGGSGALATAGGAPVAGDCVLWGGCPWAMNWLYPGVPGRGGRSLGSPPAKCGQLSATFAENDPHDPSDRPAIHANATATERQSVMRAVRLCADPRGNRRQCAFCRSSKNPAARWTGFHGDTVIGRLPQSL